MNSFKEVYEEIKRWNISYDDGWAKIVATAYCEGYLFNLKGRWSIEKTSIEEVRLELCGSSYGGPFAWVSREGVVIPVGFGMHDSLAEMLLGWDVGEVERKYARLNTVTRTPLDSMRHVDPLHQTDEMLLSVNSRMTEMPYWNWPKKENTNEPHHKSRLH